MEPSASTACLLVVDMQNDFIRPGAPFAVPDGPKITPNNRQLIDAFRAAGRPVVFTRYIADDSLARMDGVPWVAHLKPPTNACMPGHMRRYEDGVEADCAEVIDELKPEAGEPVFDKILYSSFSDTELEPHLRSAGIETLYVTGVATEVCVDDTARHAVHLGFDAVLVEDACASANAEGHRFTMENYQRNYGRIISTAGLLAHLAEA